MKNMLFCAIEVGSPLYYGIGGGFLALFLIALVIFLVVAKKRAKKEADPEGRAPDADGQEDADGKEKAAEDIDEKEAAEPQNGSEGEVKEPQAEAEELPEETQDTETEQEGTETPADSSEEPPAEQQEPAEEPVSEPETAAKEEPAPPAAEEQKEPEPAVIKEKAPENKPEKPAQKKSATKASQKESAKPFIERLIAASNVHMTYNLVKNTLLSYPGIKAKLTRAEELFVFGTDKKAAITLERGELLLHLSNDPEVIPAQFNVSKGSGEFPAKVKITEHDIDNIQKLIIFAMNVSMLTKSEKHRTVDYIQKAKDAMQRAKNK